MTAAVDCLAAQSATSSPRSRSRAPTAATLAPVQTESMARSDTKMWKFGASPTRVRNWWCVMAWYDDDKRLTYVGTYENPKDATRDANRAAQKGWVPQGTAATDGHINVGRTVTGAVLTGGWSLLFGASRSKGKLTLTFIRTPQWLAERESALAKKREAKEALALKDKADREAASAAKLQARQARQSADRGSRSRPPLAVGPGHAFSYAATFSKPDLFGKSVGHLPPGTNFDILELRGVFAFVRLQDESQCWIRADCASVGAFESPQPSPRVCRAARGGTESVRTPALKHRHAALQLRLHERAVRGAGPM